MENTLVVWVGRFSHASGYASATRSYFDAVRKAGIRALAVDVNLVDVVGPSCGIPLDINKSANKIEITSRDPKTRIVTVFHDTPDKANRIARSGNARLVGLTVFETESIPQQWLEPMLDYDEIWTGTEFNRDTFTAGGIPRYLIHVIPHCLNCDVYDNTRGGLTLPGLKDFVFLSVVSNYNRKNIGQLLNAYYAAFSPKDNVSLLLKLPAPRGGENVDEYLANAVEPFHQYGSPNLPHVKVVASRLSDEVMRQLYASCDSYVSMERAKGWDLCAFEAMALGKPTISIDWSGSTEFQNDDNALLIKPSPETVFVEPDQAINQNMYAGHKWAAISDQDAVEAFQTIFNDAALRERIGTNAKRSIREGFDVSVVGRMIVERLAQMQSYDFASRNPGSVVLTNGKVDARQPAPAPKAAAQPASPSPTGWSPDELRLLALLRQTRDVSIVRPKAKLRALESLMNDYHKVKDKLPPRSPVRDLIETFARVPRNAIGRKAMAYMSMASNEVQVYESWTDAKGGPKVNVSAAPDPKAQESKSPLEQMEPYEPGTDIEAWLQKRRSLISRVGPIAPPRDEQERLASLRDQYFGRRIFIMGNGPSLRHVDMDRLKNEYTFAANRIYLMYDKTDWRPDFYTCLDWRVTPDNYEDTNKLTGSTFFFPNRFRGLLREGEDVFWYHSRAAGPSAMEKFETDAVKGVRGGGTIVVAAIQLAWHLGFRDIYLIGVDASYKIQTSVEQSGPDRFGTGVRLNLTSTADDDINHFDPRYFGKGAKWHDPNVDEMIRGFSACRKAIEVLGGRFRNATIGGNLEVLDRVDINEILDNPRGSKMESAPAQEPGVTEVKPSVAVSSEPQTAS